MNTIDTLSRLYEEYLRDIEIARRERSNLQGAFASILLGSKGGGSHDYRFAQEVEAALKAVDPKAEEPRPIIELVLRKGAEYQNDISVAMMFTAVQQFLTPLLAYETPECRAELAKWYDKAFPRHVRTPVMVQFRKKLGESCT